MTTTTLIGLAALGAMLAGITLAAAAVVWAVWRLVQLDTLDRE